MHGRRSGWERRPWLSRANQVALTISHCQLWMELTVTRERLLLAGSGLSPPAAIGQ